jgi:hypothetical protein
MEGPRPNKTGDARPFKILEGPVYTAPAVLGQRRLTFGGGKNATWRRLGPE